MKYPVIDCHCHVYPDKIADKAVEGIRSFYNLHMSYDGRYSTLVDNGSKNGIRHYVVFSVATTPSQVESINRFIADTVEKSNGIMTGLGTLHPDSESLDEDINLIKSLGLKGIKLHPDFQRFRIDDEKCRRIYETVKGDLPVLFHTGDSRYDFSNPERLIPVLRDYPDLTVIGAHFGGWSVWDEAVSMLHGFENFYVDCSSSFDWLSPDRAREIVRTYTADRVLFGVDYPMWSYEQELERFDAMGLTESEKEKIFYKNAVRLFGIDENLLHLNQKNI